MSVGLLWGGIVLLCVLEGVRATNCEDAGVVVVASVLSTIAVVFIVLAIIGFFLWKRNRDILKPEKAGTDSPDGGAKAAPDKFAFSNPAFDKDPELGDSSIPGYVAYKEDYGLGHKQPHTGRDLSQKTWSSLPGTGAPYVRTRKSSVGSLDRNTYTGDEGTVEVWLTSQDFIGLGFNIAGSMRDGIFVSQVHNRGPANESGQFKVGDRIMSVSISFENMVYEDALTILSYASPYPVKVMLQKEQQIPKNRRLSDVRTNLNHPLYRSQSVDALHAVTMENTIPAKRCTSAIRYDKRDSPQPQHTSKRSILENNLTEEGSSTASLDDVFLDKTVPVETVDALVHREQSDLKGQGQLNFDRKISQVNETDLPSAGEDLNNQQSVNVQKSGTGYVPVSAEFNEAFQDLTEQDKLDVLRLSYADPDYIPDTSFDEGVQAKEGDISPTVAGEQKCVPMKPERKKKRSSTNSTPSQSDVETLNSPPLTPRRGVIDDVMSEQLLPPTEAPPPVPPTDHMPPPPVFTDAEASEDFITPETKTRTISIDSTKISFEPVTPSVFNKSNISENGDTTLVDRSFLDTSINDMDRTLVAQTPSGYRADSPVGGAVEEEVIAPTQRHKDQNVPTSSNIFVQISEDSVRSTPNNESKDNVDARLNQNAVSEPDFESMPELDLDLGFDSDSIMFKETFPSRNTKEHENGVAFDISVTELDAMGEKAFEEQKAKSESKKGTGGIAFEVRDDYVTGETRTVNSNAIHRTASYDIRTTHHERFMERDISSQRPTSFKGDMKHTSDQDTQDLDWSGKRLVRSDSFSEIPQGDSLNSWMNTQNLNSEDDLFNKTLEADSVLTTVRGVGDDGDEKGELSDSDSQCRSLSSSASCDSRESGTPPRDTTKINTNGEDDGLGISPDNSPLKISTIADLKADLISASPEYKESQFKVELNTAYDNDMDC